MKKLFRILSVIMLMVSVSACAGSNEAVVGADAGLDDSRIKIIDVLLTEEYYGIGVDKDKPELLKEVNEFIAKSKADGTFDEIISHYEKGGTPKAIVSAEFDSHKDQLIVATTGDFEPFDYDIGDEHYGIDKEIAVALADYLGKELVIVNNNFDIMFQTVYQHKCDICIAGITINEAREKYVDFSDPYYTAGQSIAVRVGNTEFDENMTKENIEDVLRSKNKGMVIACEDKTTGAYYCEGSEEYGYEGFPLTVLKCSSVLDCLEKLEEGSADYVIADSAVMKYIYAK